MRKAVYAGSFDPITNGHLWMIKQGAELFDELIVAIGENPDKKYTFSVKERLQALRETLKGIHGVKVDSFRDEFLVNYARSVGARFILRGIRDTRDYEFERGMRHINDDLQPEIATVFLMPPSLEVLEDRLRNRGTDEDDVIALRLKNAGDEMAQRHGFDYIVVNDKIDQAASDLEAIIRAERCRAFRQP